MLFKILTFFKGSIIFVTKWTTGRVIEDVKINKDTEKPNKPNKPKVDTEHKIQFLEYTASARSVITFALSVFVCYTIFFFLNIRPKYIQIILNYNLLTVIASFISLYMIDNLMPRIATKIVECIVDCEWELAWKEWKRISSEK